MTDDHTVIAQAVESLDQNTSRTRQVLYERARTAQVTHLRAIHPPLPESAIAKERLSLESAIRKVEADTAGKSETGPRESKPDLAQPHTAAVSLNSEHSERATLRNGPLAFAESETSPLTSRGPADFPAARAAWRSSLASCFPNSGVSTSWRWPSILLIPPVLLLRHNG